MTLVDWIFLAVAVALILFISVGFTAHFRLRKAEPSSPPLTAPPPARRSTIAGAEASIFSAVDETLQKMRSANIAFNSPSPLNVDDRGKVELRLDLHLPPATLVKMISARGVVEYATVRVSNRMTAHLSGFQFDITATTPETQALSEQEPTIWIWVVRPTTVGECDLDLDLRAIIDVDGTKEERTIETFSRTIQVTVTHRQRVSKFAKEHWKWLFGTLLIPFAGWLWKLYH